LDWRKKMIDVKPDARRLD
jgi:hypothetical protein